MEADRNLKIIFQTRFNHPKGRDIRLYAVGTIPELGLCKINSTKFSLRYAVQTVGVKRHHRLEKSIQKACKKELARSSIRARPQVHDFGLRDSEEEDSWEDEEIEIDPDFDLKPIRTKCLSEVAIPLELDPFDSGEEDLWSSDPIPIVSIGSDEKFSYLYFAWDLDKNVLWDFERFHEARTITIPKVPKTSGESQSYELVCRSVAMHNKTETLKPASYYYPSSSEECDDQPDSELLDSGDDLAF
eukprot:Gregarina_sp_Poly_1__575@NODE_1137_length_4975_cov_105_293602_g667_i2_p3_GENE_NODE_1137_length_4975_cov_105_293602_g667_i2NODE_1137_length_4975_cov_105_293602_g667_i2_p3_ORF_typecomplete_len253_score35_45CBM_20/PF00686_19/43CBM_20/PF00686_19/0_25_NODE_1137_length_4975_cov_105_293602_g667_i242174948